MRLLAVLNDFRTGSPGGVQASAAAALAGLEKEFDTDVLFIATERHGRIGAAARALRAPHSHEVVLFWHLDLLKLLPLLRVREQTKKMLFLHGVESWRKRSALTRALIGRCDVAISNTTFTLNHARQANAEIARLAQHVVHLGLGEPTTTLPPFDDVPIALMISRLHPGERYKGHDEVLAAWPLVLGQIPDAQLWIVGEGELRDDLEKEASSLNLTQHVRFLGRVSEEEKTQLIERSRCLLMPSTGEGFGLVYLEAMRLGRPCLTGIDGGREVINPPEAGFSVTHRTPQEIADAVVRLLRGDAAWHELSARARTRYEREFTAHHFQMRLNQTLREAAR